jgi:6-phosphogluconolactonase
MPSPTFVYAGSTTDTKSKGIYAFRLQTDNLEVSQNITLVPQGLAAETPNPTYLEIDVKRRLVFAVNELKEGSVSVFAADAAGKLTPVGRTACGGAPCHCALHKDGGHLLIATAGALSVVPIAADGKPGAATAAAESTQPASVAFDVTGRFAFACSPSLDRVFTYRFDQGKLTGSSVITTKKGTGPRRIVFRPDGKFAYLVNQNDSTITANSYDTNTGRLTALEMQSTLPPYFDGKNTAAEIGMHPSGKWLYVSNIGNETVVLFEIDKDKGTLSYVEEQGTGGKTPVHFGIQPDAKHLTICNQKSDTLLVCRIDSGNGRLKPSGVFATSPNPTCAKFL